LAYLGKDILGSVRSTTNEYGSLEDRYEYDAFGKPYKGDLTTGMNLGYTGKPYDTATGLYNYGFRDYQPEVARFTTVDPIRDGANWFAYVNNDPVNWVDLWGLTPSDKKSVGQKISDFFSGIIDTIASWAQKPTGETLTKTKQEKTVQNVVGYGTMALGLAGIFFSKGKIVQAGALVMGAGAMVVNDATNGVKSDPVTKFAQVSNPAVGSGDKTYVSPFP
jgi:RHS repeat-associated protein